LIPLASLRHFYFFFPYPLLPIRSPIEVGGFWFCGPRDSSFPRLPPLPPLPSAPSNFLEQVTLSFFPFCNFQSFRLFSPSTNDLFSFTIPFLTRCRAPPLLPFVSVDVSPHKFFSGFLRRSVFGFFSLTFFAFAGFPFARFLLSLYDPPPFPLKAGFLFFLFCPCSSHVLFG